MARAGTAVSTRRPGHSVVGIYLNDHLAGATVGTELARRVAASHHDAKKAAFFSVSRSREKTPGERFAGAARTFSIEGMMRDGKALQAGTSHYLSTNFAKAFGIRYTSEAKQLELCHTTSWGMSTRMIGGVIMTHGDDKGLVLPPRLAPYQVVVVPIGRGEQLDAVLPAAQELTGRLRTAGIRVHVDQRQHLSPGFKFNDWELRGVPLRLELGPRDLASGTAVLVSRLGGEKEQIALAGAPDALVKLLDDFQSSLLDRATRFRDERTRIVDDWDQFVQAVQIGWALALHCGQASCEAEIKASTGATPRCVPLSGAPETGTCVRCDSPSSYNGRVIFGRAY